MRDNLPVKEPVLVRIEDGARRPLAFALLEAALLATLGLFGVVAVGVAAPAHDAALQAPAASAATC